MSAGFRVFGALVTQIACLDEFGHVGPYVSRDDPRHKDSPVFGLAGFIVPADEVRGFGTWFFQRKCDLLDFEERHARQVQLQEIGVEAPAHERGSVIGFLSMLVSVGIILFGILSAALYLEFPSREGRMTKGRRVKLGDP